MSAENLPWNWAVGFVVALRAAAFSAPAMAADPVNLWADGPPSRAAAAASEPGGVDDSGNQQVKLLASIRLDAQPASGRVPEDRSAVLFSRPEAVAAGQTTRHTAGVLCWAPSNLACQPAYFDDVPLERYGQTVCPAAQPILSGVHFFGMFPIIPYKMGIDRTHDPIYTLGYHRVGREAPPLRQRLPFEWDAALFEAGAWTGLVFALP